MLRSVERAHPAPELVPDADILHELAGFHNRVADAALAADADWHAQIMNQSAPETRNRGLFVSDVDPSEPASKIPVGSLLHSRS